MAKSKSTGGSSLADRVVSVLTTRMPRPTQSTTWRRQRPREQEGVCSPGLAFPERQVVGAQKPP